MKRDDAEERHVAHIAGLGLRTVASGREAPMIDATKFFPDFVKGAGPNFAGRFSYLLSKEGIDIAKEDTYARSSFDDYPKGRREEG